MHFARPWDYHSLGLIRIQFHPTKVTPLTNPAKVTDQGLCYRNSDARGSQNSYQSGVISITDQLILKNEKKLRVYRRNNNGPKILPCSTPDTTLTSLLRQPSTITCRSVPSVKDGNFGVLPLFLVFCKLAGLSLSNLAISNSQVVCLSTSSLWSLLSSLAVSCSRIKSSTSCPCRPILSANYIISCRVAKVVSF